MSLKTLDIVRTLRTSKKKAKVCLFVLLLLYVWYLSKLWTNFGEHLQTDGECLEIHLWRRYVSGSESRV